MANIVSQAEARKAVKKAEKAQDRLRRIRQEHKSSIASATRTAATMGGAFITAYAMGAYPDKREVLGVDASLVVGGGLLVASMMGWAGDQEVLFESLGNGALAIYAGTKGHELGQQSQQNA